MKNILFILIGGLCIYASCNKRSDCTQSDYAFTGNFKVYPDFDSINVGDTVWVETNIPAQLRNSFTGNTVNFSGAVNLGTAIGLQEILGIVPEIKDVANDFNFFLIEGVNVNNPKTALIREYLFAEKNNIYLFKLGITAKRAGVFRFVIGSAANVYTSSNKCSKASFTFNIVNTNQHFYLFPNGSGTPPGGGTYYFKVR